MSDNQARRTSQYTEEEIKSRSRLTGIALGVGFSLGTVFGAGMMVVMNLA